MNNDFPIRDSFGDIFLFGFILFTALIIVTIVAISITTTDKILPSEQEKEYNKECINFIVKSTKETKTLITENSIVIVNICREIPE